MPKWRWPTPAGRMNVSKTTFSASRPSRSDARQRKSVGHRGSSEVQVLRLPKRTIWRLRGGLDVPKERFVSFPYCSRDADGSLVIVWAGWDHLQQATALASYYLDMKENEGWAPERLKLLLAGFRNSCRGSSNGTTNTAPSTLPAWATTSNRSSDEARDLGFTIAELRAWTPPVKPTAGRSAEERKRPCHDLH